MLDIERAMPEQRDKGKGRKEGKGGDWDDVLGHSSFYLRENAPLNRNWSVTRSDFHRPLLLLDFLGRENQSFIKVSPTTHSVDSFNSHLHSHNLEKHTLVPPQKEVLPARREMQMRLVHLRAPLVNLRRFDTLD